VGYKFSFRQLPITGWIALVLIIIILGMALFAPFISRYNPLEINMHKRLSPPSFEHWFGTDPYGRDIFSRIAFGARVSIVVAFLAVSIAFLGGIILGITAGYFGGKVDLIVMRFMDLLLSFPLLLLALLLVAVLGTGIFNLVLAISIAFLPNFARLIRATTMSLAQSPFVLAEKALGASSLRIMFKHILPNAVGPSLVLAALSLGNAVLLESSLSFLSLGVPVPTPSWGNILSEGQKYLRVAPWIATIPGLFIMLTVLGFNMLGEALRELSDPRLRQWRV